MTGRTKGGGIRNLLPIKRKFAVNVAEQRVTVVQKSVSQFYLRIQPRNVQVVLTAPLRASKTDIQAIIKKHADWINSCKAKVAKQPSHQYTDGEVHHFLGSAYKLAIRLGQGAPTGVLRGDSKIVVTSATADPDRIQQLLSDWYRKELRSIVTTLLSKWLKALDVELDFWGIRKMQTRWGSCYPKKRRIWLSLELAKKPVECIEYVLVHELVHLLEPSHNRSFKTLMTSHLPNWKILKLTLNKKEQS